MTQTILNSPIWLAIIAALCYGVGNPLIRVAQQSGATVNGMAFMIGLGTASLCLNWGGTTVLFTTTKSILIASLASFLLGIGFRSFASALSLPAGHVSIVLLIMVSYSLLSSAISMTFMEELGKIVFSRWIVGATLIIVGVFLVGTSVKPQ